MIKRAKIIFLYFAMFFFTAWLQMIALAFLFPNGGGEFHILFQLREISDIKSFFQRVYGSYLLVGACAAFIISFFKTNPNFFVISLISSFVPLTNWNKVSLYVPASSFRPYLFLLSLTIPVLTIGTSFLGARIRKLISAL